MEGFAKYLRDQEVALHAHPGYRDRPNTGASYVLGKVDEAIAHVHNSRAQITGQLDILDL